MLLSFFERLLRKGKNGVKGAYRRIKLLCIRSSIDCSILTEMQTLDRMITTECSVARLGDGEFNMIIRGEDIGYQKADGELSGELRSVLSSGSEELLVCIPHPIKWTRGYTKGAGAFWDRWLLRNGAQVRALLKDTVTQGYCFGDTQVSRPYMDRKEHTLASVVFQRFKELWRDKDVIIVEGTHTRLGVGNDMLADAKSVKRILCPAVDAFCCRSRILEAVKTIHSNELVLLALGPTATVLALDLTRIGIRAIDIGHLDIEYEWFIKGDTKKTAVCGKYVNELAHGRDVSSVCSDEKYLSQIVGSIQPDLDMDA